MPVETLIRLSPETLENLSAVLITLRPVVERNLPTDPKVLRTWLETSRQWIAEALAEVDVYLNKGS